MPEIEVEGYRKEETWKKRSAYLLAAVGSTLGLGNMYRFPNVVFQRGGIAFFIPFLMVLFLIGVPMLTQEMALGQKFQSGDVEAYGRMNKRFRGVGLASVVGVFVSLTYTSVLTSYTFVYFAGSFESPLPWAYDGTYGNYTECLSVIGGSNCSHSDGSFGECPSQGLDCENSAENFFLEVTKQADDIKSGSGEMALSLLGATFFVWVCIYASVFKGVSSISYVAYVTVPVPVLFLLILFIKAITLEGFGDGVEDYLTPEFGDLEDEPSVWMEAVYQCFYSLPVFMGVMTAYSSFTRTGSVALDGKIVALANVSITFISGFFIFGILGYLVNVGGDDDYDTSSFNGLLIAIPIALLRFESAGFFSALFFLMLFMFGIVSGFAMITACATVICDTDMARKNKWDKRLVSLVLCVVGFLLSIPYCTDVGYYHIELINDYINTKGKIFVGMMEAFVVGWVYLYEDQCQLVGASAVKLWNFGYWFLLIFSIVLGFSLAEKQYYISERVNSFDGGIGDKSALLGFFICVIGWPHVAVVAVSRAMAFNPDISMREAFWGVMGWWGAEDIRAHVNSGCGASEWESSREEERRICLSCGCSKLSIIWGLLIKYVVPGFLLVVLFYQMRRETFGPVQEASVYQFEGFLPFIVMVLCVLVVMIFPSLMEQSCDHKDDEMMKTVEMSGPDSTNDQVL